MADNYKFYSERADDAAEAASKATLDNVRDRELRSEKTWRALAEKASAVALKRESDERERAERKAAEEWSDAAAMEDEASEDEPTAHSPSEPE